MSPFVRIKLFGIKESRYNQTSAKPLDSNKQFIFVIFDVQLPLTCQSAYYCTNRQCWPVGQFWLVLYNQLMQLCTARTVLSGPIRPVSVHSGKFSTRMVTNGKKEKTEMTNY